MAKHNREPAAFGRLRVETRILNKLVFQDSQPPSGGCVLKQQKKKCCPVAAKPAAFGRLRVETTLLTE